MGGVLQYATALDCGVREASTSFNSRYYVTHFPGGLMWAEPWGPTESELYWPDVAIGDPRTLESCIRRKCRGSGSHAATSSCSPPSHWRRRSHDPGFMPSTTSAARSNGRGNTSSPLPTCAPLRQPGLPHPLGRMTVARPSSDSRPGLSVIKRIPDLRVGFDGRFLQDKFSGIGRYAFELLKKLGALDGCHKIILFVDPSLPNSRFSLSEVADLDHVELVTTCTRLRSIQEFGYWWPQARRHRLSVFHTPDFWSPLALPCPVVSTVHDMIPDISRDYLSSRAFGVGYRLSSRTMMRHARAIIAISEATRDDIGRYAGTWASRKTTVIPNGRDERLRPVTSMPVLEAVRSKYGLPERFVLAVAIRRPHKNIDQLVRAFEQFTDIPHKLVLVGAKERRFRDQAQASIRRLGSRVVELSFVPDEDLLALYSMADLFVHASLAEGFGLPVLEAMACGCPVACSNTTSLPEVAGGATLHFDPTSTDDIARKMRDALESPSLRADLRSRGLARAATFSWGMAARSTLELYRTVSLGTPQQSS
jgi:glycosyltransferase involved in cell wall biosynthesis